MESEERGESIPEYDEKWDGGVLKLIVYTGMIPSLEFSTGYTYTKGGRSRCLILPLPPDFRIPDLDAIHIKEGLKPNSVLIVEERIRYKGEAKKLWRWQRLFRNPGRTSVRHVILKEGKRNIIWLSKNDVLKITMRNLYVDKFFIDKLYDRSRTENPD